MLTIAVVAYNFELSRQACKKLARSDMSAFPILVKDNFVLMNDGTKYLAISSNTDNLRGLSVDQIIFVDDSRWEIYFKRKEIIRILERALSNPYIPRDFLKQEFEL